MDKFNYDNLAEIATDLLEGFGITYYLKRSPVTVTTNGVQTTVKRPAVQILGVKVNYNAKEIDGTIIKTGDMALICDNRIKDIAAGDIVVIAGQSWRVENPNPVIPADTLICYKLQLRMEL